MEETIISCSQCGAKNRLKSPTPSQAPVCGKCKNLLPWLVTATDISFRNELEAPIPVLVDFWAEWCSPCRMVAPVLEELARDNAGKIKVVKLNVDQNPATAAQYDVQSIPTMILFKEGQAIERLVGAMSKPALMQRFGPHLT